MSIIRSVVRSVVRPVIRSVVGADGPTPPAGTGRFLSTFGGDKHIDLGATLTPASNVFTVKLTIIPTADDVTSGAALIGQHSGINPRIDISATTGVIRARYEVIGGGTKTLLSTSPAVAGEAMQITFASTATVGTRLNIDGALEDDDVTLVDETLFGVDIIGARDGHTFNFRGEIYDVQLPDGIEYQTYAIDEEIGTDVVASPVSGAKNGTWSIEPVRTQDDLPDFELTSITLRGHYDSSFASSVTESLGSVSAISDRSPYRQNLAQAVGALQPQTGIRTINALNVMTGDGTQWLGDDDNLTSSTGNVIVSMVMAVDGVDHTNNALISSDAVTQDFQYEAGSATDFDGLLQGLDGGIALTGGPFGGVHLHTIEANFDAGTAEVFVDSVSRGTGTYTTILDTVQFLKVLSNRNEAQPIEGAICQIIITEDMTKRAEIETLLAEKWGTGERWQSIFGGTSYVDHSTWTPTTSDFVISGTDVFVAADIGIQITIASDADAGTTERILKSNTDKLTFRYTDNLGFSRSLTSTYIIVAGVKIEWSLRIESGVPVINVNGVSGTRPDIVDHTDVNILRIGASDTGGQIQEGRVLARSYTDSSDSSNSRAYRFQEASGVIAVDALGDGSTNGTFNIEPTRIFE